MNYTTPINPYLPVESATVAINSLAQQKSASGLKVFNLSAGEPKLAPHPLVIDAVFDALKQGKTLYPPVSGVPQLKTLATRWMNDSYQCNFADENCLVVNGGKLGIYLLLQLLLQPEDEVIIAAPYWVSYPALTHLFAGNATIITTSPDNGWKITPAMLRQACTCKSRILILNNAANPTGMLYSKDELAQLLQIAAEQNLLVISDEVYSTLVYDDNSYVSCGAFPEYQDRVFIIQSCSKNFGMTGWRVGFVFAPTYIIQPLTSLLSQCTSGVTTVSQWVAVKMFEHAAQVTGWINQHMQQRRDVLCQALQQHFHCTPQPPRSSLYLFIALHDLGVSTTDSIAFCQQALEQANVAIIPGIAFGQEGFIRLSFGADAENLEHGVAALAQFCHKTTGE